MLYLLFSLAHVLVLLFLVVVLWRERPRPETVFVLLFLFLLFGGWPGQTMNGALGRVRLLLLLLLLLQWFLGAFADIEMLLFLLLSSDTQVKRKGVKSTFSFLPISLLLPLLYRLHPRSVPLVLLRFRLWLLAPPGLLLLLLLGGLPALLLFLQVIKFKRNLSH